MLYPDFHELVAFKSKKFKPIPRLRRSVTSTVPGNHHSPFRGQGLEFDSVRQYVPGDDIRSIDWRVTARTGSPHLKLFKEEKERQVILCVDMNSTMRFGTRKTFKSVQAARAASLLGWQGLSQHHSVSACLFGDVPEGIQFFSPKSTRKSFSAMLKMLSEPPGEEHVVPIYEALQYVNKASHTGSLVYLISDFMEFEHLAQYKAILSRLNKRCDVVFIAINDIADRSIYPAGLIGFCINASEKTYVNTESLIGRESYTHLWEENRQKLYAITSSFKIPLIELTTESDIQRDLVLGLQTIGKRKKE